MIPREKAALDEALADTFPASGLHRRPYQWPRPGRNTARPAMPRAEAGQAFGPQPSWERLHGTGLTPLKVDPRVRE